MDKKLMGLVSLFFLTFFVFISVVVFSKPLSLFTRASEKSEPSSAKSLIFAWPLSSGVASSEKVKVDVFVRSETGNPIPNRQIEAKTTLGTISPTTISSDKIGKASFFLTSQTAGTAQVSATVDNRTRISQQVSVKFY